MVLKNNYVRINYKTIPEKLKFPETTFPYYEGLNAMRNNQYWLGLYWRNNQYDIDFMTAACKLCQETNISKINIIPWKAFIIKGIKASDRIRWKINGQVWYQRASFLARIELALARPR